jgi:hypothetical protein
MPKIMYSKLGEDKKLNQIVMAGSHDAGITKGGANAQTQDLDIGGQALAGIRFFDLRVAAFAKGRGYHGDKQVKSRPSMPTRN